MSDITKNIEMTAGYFTYQTSLQDRFCLGWEFTGGSSERLFCKDPTCGNQAGNCFYLETFQISCTSGSADAFDGSAGSKLWGFACSSMVGAQLFMDFRPNAIKCLTADNTSSFCISADNGYVSGHITGFFGPA